jgi:hypothetical protein
MTIGKLYDEITRIKTQMEENGLKNEWKKWRENIIIISSDPEGNSHSSIDPNWSLGKYMEDDKEVWHPDYDEEDNEVYEDYVEEEGIDAIVFYPNY